jgi:hypothetical protein
MDLGLGFDMIKNLKSSLLIMSLLAGTSCLKPPTLSADNGPLAAPVDVQIAILKAWNNADFNTIRANEFLYIEQDQKISTLDTKVVYKEASEVKERVVDNAADTISYRFEIQSQAMENGNFKPITVIEDEMTVPKTIPTVSMPAAKPQEQAALPNSVETLQKSMSSGNVGLYANGARNHFIGIYTINAMLMACVKDKDWDVSCHNLQITEGTRPPPIGVGSQGNCGGIEGCMIRYTKIAFDLVVNITDEDSGSTRAEKVNYELVISPDVPYLSRLLDFCYQGMVPTQSQKVLVKMCNKVQNFMIGIPN